MHVDFDGLRMRMVDAYNRLANELNASIKDISWDPHVIIDVPDLEEPMEDLRQVIVTLTCISSKEAGIKELPECDLIEFNPQP